MVVKNNSELIINTLTNLLEKVNIDYWVISDLGSQDNTKELIQSFFDEKEIKGELFDDEFVDFGTNKTFALNHAYGKSEYLLIMNCGDQIYGKLIFPDTFDYDAYYLQYGTDDLSYLEISFINNNKRWEYKGILDAFIMPMEDSTTTILGGTYLITKYEDQQDPENEILLLESAFQETTDNLLKIKYAFNCANAYNIIQNYDLAIEWYKKAIEIEDFNGKQEQYMACIALHDIYTNIKNTEAGIEYLEKSYNFDNTRVEGILLLIQYAIKLDLKDEVFAYYSLIQEYYENEYLNDNIFKKLYVNALDYEYVLPATMISQCTDKPEIGIKMYEIIFNKRVLNIGTWWINYLYNNIQFGIDKFPQTEEFLKSMIAYVNSYDKDIENRKFIKCVLSYYKRVLNMDCGSI